MKKLLIGLVMMLYASIAVAQNIYQVIIKDAKTNQVLSGTTVRVIGTPISGSADEAGRVVLVHIPNGKQVITYRYIGYQSASDTLLFPLWQTAPAQVLLMPQGQAQTLNEAENEDELDEVIVTATRSSRTIASNPMRVELIAGEELDEKGNMKPGDIRMLLAESTGIQTQQTSATSGNSSIRIQGLDGKYTQVIRDGFPLYSGFSAGLGLLQIAPLDLQQVEVIKGSASTLYGGGAIAGLVNLVSKKPTDVRQFEVLLNGTSAGGLDASTFYAQKFKKIGLTLYGAYNHGSAYDPADIGFTAIPRFNRYTLNPKLYLYLSDGTTLMAGLNGTVESRLGGDIKYVKGHPSEQHNYFECNKTGRYSSQAELDHAFNTHEKLVLRNSVSYYDRQISLPQYLFSGVQIATYSEANYSRKGENADWVAGLNFLSDHFSEDGNHDFPLRNYQHSTLGLFLQNTFNAGRALSVESGIRADHHNAYGFFLLPRISALWKISDQLSTRLGGGMGYKAPTIFTEDAERIQFRNVLPVDVAQTKAERSLGGNYDINYKTGLFDGQVAFSINQLFFYTRVNHPILLSAVGNNLQYNQPAGYLDTKGMETNVKLTCHDFKLFLGYTYADVNQRKDGTTVGYPLVSRRRLNNVLMYEVDDKWKLGAEAYYFSPQLLNDGNTGKSYWTAGFMAEKIWPRFSLFMNFENLTDTRQTRFDSIYTGTATDPVFGDIYAPLDGFVVNGGIKLKM